MAGSACVWSTWQLCADHRPWPRGGRPNASISVIFIVPEDDIPEIMTAIHAGTALEVKAYDRANVTYLATGKVSALDSQIDPTTGTVKLRADFDNLDDKLFQTSRQCPALAKDPARRRDPAFERGSARRAWNFCLPRRCR